MYMFEDGKPRIVIPRGLRILIINNLHAANQGSTSMAARGRKSVYWNEKDRDIQQNASESRDYRGIAPSRPPKPLIMTDPPEYPSSGCRQYCSYYHCCVYAVLGDVTHSSEATVHSHSCFRGCWGTNPNHLCLLFLRTGGADTDTYKL